LFLPQVEGTHQSSAAFLDGRPLEPRVDRLLREADEHALAPVLDGREPRDVSRQTGPLDADGQLAVHVRRIGLEPREADLGHDLAQTVDQHDAIDES
jgi:hypothetical protein